MNRHVLPAFAALLYLALVPAAQAVTFNDGLAHIIPTDTADIIDTNGGVAADVKSSTDLTLTTGGTISIDDTTDTTKATTGVRLGQNVADDDSTFTFSGGTLSVTDTMDVGGGNENAFGVEAKEKSKVTISGSGSFKVSNADKGNAVGIRAGENTTVDIQSGGTIDSIVDTGTGGAMGIQVLGDATTSMSVTVAGEISAVTESGAGNAFGIRLENNAAATVEVTSTGKILGISEADDNDAFGIDANGSGNDSSVKVAGNIAIANSTGAGNAYGIRMQGTSDLELTTAGLITVNESGTGNAFGIRADNSAFVDFKGGILIQDEAGNGSAYGIQARDNSKILAHGTITIDDELDDNDAYGIWAEDNSTVQFGSTINIDGESGGGVAHGIRARDNAVVDVAGDVNVTEADGGSARIFRTDETSTINVRNGFAYTLSEGGGGNPRLAELVENSLINIYGGDVTNTSGTSGTRIDVLDFAQLRFFGSNFFVDDVATPVGTVFTTAVDKEYKVEGILGDGTAFTTFVWLNAEPGENPSFAVLIPEPSTLTLWGLGLASLGFFGTRRRKR